MLTVTQAEEVRKSFEGKLLSEKTARGSVNRFILENLRDGFGAGRPRLVVVGQEPAWSVPILFVSSQQVPEEVGEVLVQAVDGSLLGFTPLAEIYRNARPISIAPRS
jgi:hypothetical protein